MENVYRLKCGNLINIGHQFTQFRNELCPESVNQMPQTYDDVRELWNIPSGVAESSLEDSISLTNLDQSDDIPIFDVNLHDLHSRQGQKFIEIPSKAMRLKCVRHRVEEDASKSRMNIQGKYNRYRYIEHNVNSSERLCDLVPFNEILITVRVYEPFIYKRGEGTQRKPRLSQELLVLGRQKLTELRDKIYCHCQYGPFKDISNDFESIKNTETEASQQTMNKEQEFGFFFITDTFYNSASTDHMTEIREWMKRQPDFGPVHVKPMQDTKFEDLNIRVGFPQVYRHCLNCEHIISFTDIRLLAPDDSLNSSEYPMLRCISSTKMTLCMICGIIEASFVVNKNNVHIMDPMYMCQNCLISFHYIDGKKIGSFQAFRYYGNRPIIN